MSKRLDFYDVIKGVAIFMVVMGHIITMCIRDIDSAFIFKIIGQSHIPLFFFVSGFFTYKALKDPQGNIAEEFLQPALFKRIKQLLVPTIAVGALWLWYFPHSGLQSPLDSTVSGMLLSPWKNGYWFPLVLFLVFVIYYVFSILAGVLRPTVNIITTAVLVWVLLKVGANALDEKLCDLFSLRLVAQFYPIFMVGVFARRHESLFYKAVENGYVQTVAILTGAVAFYVSAYYWEFPYIPEDALMLISLVYYTCLSLVAVALAKKFTEAYTESHIKNVITLLGRKSLEIYLLHYFFLFPMTGLQATMVNRGLGCTPLFITSALAAAIVIAVVLAVNEVISLSPILSPVLPVNYSQRKK